MSSHCTYKHFVEHCWELQISKAIAMSIVFKLCFPLRKTCGRQGQKIRKPEKKKKWHENNQNIVLPEVDALHWSHEWMNGWMNEGQSFERDKLNSECLLKIGGHWESGKIFLQRFIGSCLGYISVVWWSSFNEDYKINWPLAIMDSWPVSSSVKTKSVDLFSLFLHLCFCKSPFSRAQTAAL